MATTAMDYENSGGDRFDGMLGPLDTRFIQTRPFPHRDSEMSPSVTNLDPFQTKLPATIATTAVPLHAATTAATIALVAAPRPLVAIG